MNRHTIPLCPYWSITVYDSVFPWLCPLKPEFNLVHSSSSSIVSFTDLSKPFWSKTIFPPRCLMVKVLTHSRINSSACSSQVNFLLRKTCIAVLKPFFILHWWRILVVTLINIFKFIYFQFILFIFFYLITFYFFIFKYFSDFISFNYLLLKILLIF